MAGIDLVKVGVPRKKKKKKMYVMLRSVLSVNEFLEGNCTIDRSIKPSTNIQNDRSEWERLFQECMMFEIKKKKHFENI